MHAAAGRAVAAGGSECRSARRCPSLRRSLVLALVVCWPLSSAAETLVVNDRVEPFALEDQFGKLRSIDAQTHVILFSRDMDGGDLLKSALKNRPKGDLESRGIAYVSDISGMPSLVARLFALPSMRRRPYPMLLDRTGQVTANLPDEAGRATVIRLSALRIEGIEYLDDEAAIVAAVEATPAAAPGSPDSASP